MKRKWLGVGIVLLFVGVSIIPSIKGNVMDMNRFDNKINNSTIKYTAIVVGLIQDMYKQPLEHYFKFTALFIFIAIFENRQKIGQGIYPPGYPLSFYCDAQMGIVTKHIICATFISHYPYYDSPTYSQYSDICLDSFEERLYL